MDSQMQNTLKDICNKLSAMLVGVFSKYNPYILNIFSHIYLTLASKETEVLYIVKDSQNNYTCLKSAVDKDIVYVVLCPYSNRNMEAVHLRRSLSKLGKGPITGLFDKQTKYTIGNITYILDFDGNGNGTFNKKYNVNISYDIMCTDAMLYSNYNIKEEKTIESGSRYYNLLLNLLQLIKDNSNISLIAYSNKAIYKDKELMREKFTLANKTYTADNKEELDILAARRLMANRHYFYYYQSPISCIA